MDIYSKVHNDSNSNKKIIIIITILIEINRTHAHVINQNVVCASCAYNAVYMLYYIIVCV